MPRYECEVEVRTRYTVVVEAVDRVASFDAFKDRRNWIESTEHETVTEAVGIPVRVSAEEDAMTTAKALAEAS